MANRLLNTNIRIDQFLSSPANRAITTAEGHAQVFGVGLDEIIQDKRLFHASSRQIKQVIAETPDHINTLALFGHNPGLTDLINALSDFDLWNLPTCAVCGIQFEIDSWSKVIDNKGIKFHFDYPKSRS